MPAGVPYDPHQAAAVVQVWDDQPCLNCGHKRRVHMHYRAGMDCGLCSCPNLSTGWMARLRRWHEARAFERTLRRS